MFKPRTATAENPAPLVVVVPGFQRSKETLSNLSIELSRRGIVVIAIDPYAQGGSSSSMSTRAATKEGYGMFAIVEYAHDTPNMNYVDKKRIGATGHSAGGLAAIRGAQYFGKVAKKENTFSKLQSVFVSGMVRMGFKEKNLKNIKSNVGMSYALYDEGSWQNELQHGDMKNAPEAIRLVNSGRFKTEDPIESINIGYYYGEIDQRTSRVVYNEKTLHPFQPYSLDAMTNQIDYFLKVFGVDNVIHGKNQTWYWKEALTLVSLVSSFLLVLPLARLFLEIPFFRSLVCSVPKPLPKPHGRGKVVFWFLFGFTAVVACFSYIPLSELSKTLFFEASNRHQTWFFPQRMNNAVMLWALLNGSIGLLLFFVNYHFFGRKNGVRPEMWGTEIKPKELAKTALLGLVVFLCYFLVLYLIYYIFHVDYRFIFIGVRKFRPIILALLPMYAPFFFIFFLSNSLRVNGAMRFDSKWGWSGMFLAAVANALGLFMILVVQYLAFGLTGTVYWTTGWLYVNLLFAIVPIMFVLPYFHRYFFQLTGRVYLGPITMCLIFIMILLSNTVCYLPI